MAKKSQKKSKKDESVEEQQSLMPFIRQSFVVLISLGFMVGLFGAVDDLVYNDQRYVLKPDSLKIDHLPSWLVQDEQLKSDLELPFGEITIFNQNLEQIIKESLEKAPWVHHVQHIQRKLPHHIEVDLAVRQPVARVRQGLRRHLVDSEAVRLPSNLYENLDHLPVLEGVDTRLPEHGDAWHDENLNHALLFLSKWHARKFQTKYESMRILKIKCSTSQELMEGRPQFTIQVSRRLRLYFNSGSEEGDLPLDLALDNLEKILIRDPHLRYIRSYIDLRWASPALQ